MDRSAAELVLAQRRYFDSGVTRPLEFRRRRLEALKKAIKSREEALLRALHDDMRKPPFEAFAGEVGRLYKELGHALKHFEGWASPRKLRTELVNQPGTTRIYQQPYGVVVIISPWNYPCQLALSPLIGALAAGNCAILKPSECAPHTAAVLAELVRDTFDPAYVALVEGGPEATQALLAVPTDSIFFTGSPAVGRLVLEQAAKHLVPVTLELGGKSPVIVDHDARLDLAARRIVWAKFFNAGQTCIAPDYLLVHRSIKAKLCEYLVAAIRTAFGEEPRQSPDFARIVNERHFDRLAALLADAKPLCGGTTRREELYIAPTLLDATLSSAAMQEEVFGPILPVVEFETLEEALSLVRRHPDPLALYYFSESARSQERVLEETRSGGACINDTMSQTTSSADHPFGGIGRSGMGSYHGRYTFQAFSHQRIVYQKSSALEVKLRYPPYGERLAWLKKLLR